MAYNVEQQTTGVQGAGDEIIFVVRDTTNFAEPKYRYICRISVDGNVVIKLKQLPNNANCAVFNVRDIARAYVYQDDNPYSLGAETLDGTADTTEIFATNTHAIKNIELRFGYEYAVDASAPPTETLLPATDKEVPLVNGSFFLPGDTYPLVNGANQYLMTNSSKLFLSDAMLDGSEVPMRVASDNRAALAFLSGNDVGSTGPVWMHITYYNGDTQLSTSAIQNTTANGGYPPGSTTDTTRWLLYVGVGPYNLENQTINATVKPSNNAGWTRYEIQMASSNILSGNETSRAYNFVQVPCSRYFETAHAYTLHWWNSKGGVDNLVCAGKVVQSQETNRQDYRVKGGNAFDANGVTVDYANRSYQGGRRSGRVQTTTKLKLTINEFDPDLYTPLIQSLLNSERVYLSGSGDFGLNVSRFDEGVVQAYVTDTQMEYLSGVNDQAAAYTINVEISRRRPNP